MQALAAYSHTRLTNKLAGPDANPEIHPAEPPDGRELAFPGSEEKTGSPPQTYAGVDGIMSCHPDRLYMPKTGHRTVPFRRAITFATWYMLLVWMFALTAH